MSSDFRKDFKFFREYPDLVYFDNAATTQKPDVVLERMVRYYESENANPLRGVYDLSVKATTVYEDARERTARFIGASSPSEIVFTRNATESLNLIARSYGEAFIKELASTSVKGLIIPDLPNEHADMIAPYLEGSDIALVPLVSLTTGIERQKALIQEAEGFIYAVAINGVTGKMGNYRDDLDQHLAALRDLATISVLTGFGVSTQEDIQRFNQVSDGVIVGSKIVRDLHEGKTSDVKAFVDYGSHFNKC